MMGHVAVLQWWKDSGLTLKYRGCLALASASSRISVLQWWKDSGLPLPNKIDTVDSVESIEVLEWWRESGLELHCCRAMDEASGSGSVHILEWWKSSKLELTYTSRAMDRASANGHVACLQWWKNSGQELRYSSPLDVRSFTPPVVNWWVHSVLPVEIAEEDLIKACQRGRLDILQLWKKHSPDLVYSEKLLDSAMISGNLAALQWWKESGLELKFSSWVPASLKKKSAARKWLKDNGFFRAI
ncbi:hypothetical protein DFJ73DRAFT_834411 [Zopfochytrium polystomum]|nr:hypothetical protein DFJ73DRAFT_834411 [Zopfochytrium polystomum]